MGNLKNRKKERIYVLDIPQSGNHHPECKVFGLVARKCKAPQVVGEIIAGLLIGPCVLNLVQISDSISIFARDRRCDAHVHHRPRHQPERADQGRPHRHPDRYRWRGCASGGRHLIIWCVLRLCRSWQPGVLPGAVHRYHYDRYQCVHHGGNLAGAWAPEEFFGHDYRQRRCH